MTQSLTQAPAAIAPIASIAFDTPPHRLSGTVYVALLNHQGQWDAIGDAAHQPPHKAPAQAPVLAVQPRSTLSASGAQVAVPAGGAYTVGASLALVIGRTACRLAEQDALDAIAGYLLVADLSEPHASHYRPAVRHRTCDGSCVLGRRVVAASSVSQPDALDVRVEINGQLAQASTTGQRLRGVARLLADVTGFMTLQPGDLLLLGEAAGAPLARAGDAVRITLSDGGTLNESLDFSLAEDAPATEPAPETAATDKAATAKAAAAQARSVSTGLPPITARVAHAGAIHTATPHPDGLRLADGRVLAEDAVVWLPPFEVGTVIALGLNYADHVKELSKELTLTAQDEPLVFLKGPGSLLGHRGVTRRPDGVAFMHYECELAVVIGRTAKNVARKDAMAHVAGYTVCNDYAIRDYLENWYRPNLRVKNRDGGTVLGPWFVPAAHVPDPHRLALSTRVNGQITQTGSTAQMIHDIPALIEYLSAFMTLQAGDVILTGTPDGVVNVSAGDEVVCEIEGIGRLVGHIASDALFNR